jgi:hypothetical protein
MHEGRSYIWGALCEGRLIYEWDQSIDDINIYIKPPKACLKKYQEELRSKL